MIRLTRAQVREIDRRCIEDFGIPGIVLMENAARHVANAAMAMLEPSNTKHVLIVCGAGNNGGDGFAAARMLHQEGAKVEIAFSDEPSKLSPDAAENVKRLLELRLHTAPATHAKIRRTKCDLIIDAIFGTGLSNPPRVAAAELIDAINTTGRPVLAVDVPSGLDCDTGEPLGPSCIRAARTVTFVAEKIGFANPTSKQYTGEMVVGDIGCPREVIDAVAQSTS